MNDRLDEEAATGLHGRGARRSHRHNVSDDKCECDSRLCYRRPMSSPVPASVFARSIARVVDRVHIASRDAVPPEEIAGLAGLSVPVAVANMVVSFVPADAMTWSEFDGILRYVPAEYARGQAAQLVQAGVLASDEDRLRYTDAGRAAAQAAIDLLPAALDAFWAADVDRLGSLASVLAGVAGRAVTSGLPSPATIARTLVPRVSSAAYDVARSVAIIRRHRADVHATAWTEAGFTAARVQALGARSERDRIEARTDALNAPIWEPLTGDEQLLVLAGLGGLNGVGTPT
jgi:hypothetical protein